MRYEDLNGFFCERIGERVGKKLAEIHPERPIDHRMVNHVVGVIVLIADQNNVSRAAERLRDIKLATGETDCSLDSAVEDVAVVKERFAAEVSILRDLYQLQEGNADISEIIAHMEKRLLEP